MDDDIGGILLAHPFAHQAYIQTITGVNYLDDLLNEMTKETTDEESEPPQQAAPTNQAPSTRKEHARPGMRKAFFDCFIYAHHLHHYFINCIHIN